MIIHKIKGLHIEGRRHMSIDNGVQEYLNPKLIYLPLTNGIVPYRSIVNVGASVLKGQIVALREDRFAHPVHSPVSGTILSIKKMWHASGKIVDTLEIENDFQENVTSEWGKSLDLDALTKEDVVERVKNCGIVGLGGAGFPTYVKYMPTRKQEVFIVNGAECEPYLTDDDTLLRTRTDKILRGIKYILKTIGANHAYIAIKKSKIELIKFLKETITNLPKIEIFELDDVYPTGWERSIIEKVTGKHYVTLPSEVGVVVNNVQTVVAVCEAIEENKPLIERMLTITGEGIKTPQNIFLKIGTRAYELIERSGGYVDDLKEAYLIAGGPMTGKAIYDDSLVVSSTLGAIIVMPVKSTIVQPCLGCGKCSERCPAFLVPTEIRRASENKDYATLEKLHTMSCVQCGLCSYVCPSRISITEYVGKAQDELRKYRASNMVKKG